MNNNVNNIRNTIPYYCKGTVLFLRIYITKYIRLRRYLTHETVPFKTQFDGSDTV